MWKSVEMAIWTIRNISYFTKKIVGSQFLKNAAPGGQFSVFLERLAYSKDEKNTVRFTCWVSIRFTNKYFVV